MYKNNLKAFACSQAYILRCVKRCIYLICKVLRVSNATPITSQNPSIYLCTIPKMEKLLINHRQQLLFIAVVCLFAVLIISSGRIFVNSLGAKNRANIEQHAWVSIDHNIESELPLIQRKEWQSYARNNPEEFLRANTIQYLNINNIQKNFDPRDIIAGSFKNILANIVITAREHIRKIDIP